MAGAVEIASLAGFDFLVLDCEHGLFHIESSASMIATSDAAGIPVIVRVPSASSDQVGLFLDAGAAGILFPRVDGVETARNAVASAKFAPEGRRGLGGVRANKYGMSPLDSFVREANQNTLVAIQIETAGALADVGEIARQVEVDLLFVGPNDLSQALGIPGVYDDPSFAQAVQRVAQEAGNFHKAAGIMLRNRTQIPELQALGYRFFTTSDRALLSESARLWRSAIGQTT